MSITQLSFPPIIRAARNRHLHRTHSPHLLFPLSLFPPPPFGPNRLAENEQAKTRANTQTDHCLLTQSTSSLMTCHWLVFHVSFWTRETKWPLLYSSLPHFDRRFFLLFAAATLFSRRSWHVAHIATTCNMCSPSLLAVHHCSVNGPINPCKTRRGRESCYILKKIKTLLSQLLVTSSHCNLHYGRTHVSPSLLKAALGHFYWLRVNSSSSASGQ